MIERPEPTGFDVSNIVSIHLKDPDGVLRSRCSPRPQSYRYPVDDQVHAPLIAPVDDGVFARIVDLPKLAFFHGPLFAAHGELDPLGRVDRNVDTAAVQQRIAGIDVGWSLDRDQGVASDRET